MVSENDTTNLNVFRDCLSTTIIERLSPQSGKRTKKRVSKGRKNEIKPVVRTEEADINDASELGDFVEVCPPLSLLACCIPNVSAVPCRRDIFIVA